MLFTSPRKELTFSLSMTFTPMMTSLNSWRGVALLEEVVCATAASVVATVGMAELLINRQAKTIPEKTTILLSISFVDEQIR